MLRKLQFGSGGRNLEGWENYDAEVDISKPLPFPDNCASRIFAEHVIEHVTHQEAWNFLEECKRVLAPGGVVRIAIPDVERISCFVNDEYMQVVQRTVGGDGSARAAIKAAVFEHGHKAAWTKQLLWVFMHTIGFDVIEECPGRSQHRDLVNVEQHWKTVGKKVSDTETSVVEGVKPA